MAMGAACVVVGCTLDPLGTMATPGAGAGAGSAAASGGAGGTEATSAAGGTGGMGGTASAGGAVGEGGEGGAGGAAQPPILTTCAGLLAIDPTPATGTYEIDPDGPNGDAPFFVQCEMATDGGGWTLVALEEAGDTRTLRYLGTENGTPDDLLQGESAMIGARFQGRYTEVRIEWSTDQYIQFNRNGAEIFDNSEALSLPVTGLTTSSNALQGWVTGGGGAKLCRAAVDPNVRPGDTSWAIKPVNDTHVACGCNDMSWAGKGAYYGGSGSGCTVCTCTAGSFVGVKDDGDPKSGVTAYNTRIYIR